MPFSEFNIELQEEINEKMGYWVSQLLLILPTRASTVLWQG